LLSRLIAIMLGRLRMSVADCITAYLVLSEPVFHQIGPRWERRFDTEELVGALKELVKQQGLPEAVLLKNTLEETGCRA
jgi:hypothetical protein